MRAVAQHDDTAKPFALGGRLTEQPRSLIAVLSRRAQGPSLDPPPYSTQLRLVAVRRGRPRTRARLGVAEVDVGVAHAYAVAAGVCDQGLG
jgi:hypothetical protein